MVFVKSPKKIKSSFAISFTTEKYLAIKESLNRDLFGTAHKKKLFGNDFDNYDIIEAAKKVKRDRHLLNVSKEDIL